MKHSAVVYSWRRSPSVYAVPSHPAFVFSNLGPLHSHTSVIHAMFVHLFDEGKQFRPDSFLDLVDRMSRKGLEQWTMDMTFFCHSPESQRELLDNNVFKKGTVILQAGLEVANPLSGW